MTNAELIEKYPFLKPVNWLTGEPIKNYDPEVDGTFLDDMPIGWKKAFGLQLCKELKDDLVLNNWLDKYRVVQVKEKYGRLCWYDNGVPIHSNSYDIISKYEDMSAHICVECGAPATRMSTGWICPYCDEHAPEKSIPLALDFFLF